MSAIKTGRYGNHESRFLLLGEMKYLPQSEGVSFAEEC
jgi:hypothetical protein